MRRTISELRDLTSAANAAFRGLVRRVAIKLATADRLWQFAGFETAPGEFEPFDKVRTFQGIGFSSRPRAGKGEAVIVNIGGAAAHPVAIATADPSSEPTDLEADESQMHNSLAQVRVTAAGVVEVTDRAGGTAHALALLSDLDDLRTWISTHTHATAGTGAPSVPVQVASLPNGAGTDILKGQ